ncbi:MAG: AAA family ATPase, partial [Solobacterium sp.]|nr:AAA family ATPase [Solobacterium sp.]
LRLLKENPYRVIEECDGFGFKTADKIGQYIGIDAKDSRRLVALLISLTMEMCMSSGDSYVLKQRLQQRFHEESDEASDFDSLLEECILRKQLVLENERVYPISQFDAESYIANYLSNFPMQHLDPIDMHYLHQSLDDLQKESGIHYDETQIHAIQSFFEHDFMIITGGPGTGKTTIVKALVHLVKNLYPFSVLSLLAPTGRAAKRLAELTEHDATTIHSFLRWDLESNTFGANQDNPILSDILIIDEFSMVDQWVFYNLVKASSGVKKICIIGDEDQLPSVGPGAVFRDLMEVNFYPVIRLETIYRQEEGSGVISLAKDIRDGLLQPNYSQDVSFIETKRADIKNHIQTIVNYALDKGYELNDIQVLSPKYSGVAGIDLLNSALQEKFNPADKHKKEIKVGYTILREGDKILQLKNQPDDDVYNGDIGTLIEILPAKESGVGKTILIVDFQGIFVEYTQENWNNITLAYCISIHKSQGSEYPIVIMPITHQMTGMLQRKLLYTGVTRAKQSLIILGELKAFYRGIEILETHSRQTTLKEKISLRMWR